MSQQDLDLEHLKKITPYSLPDNVGESGWNTAQVKKKFYDGFFYIYGLFKEFKDLMTAKTTEIEGDITELETGYNNIINGIVKAKKAEQDKDGNEFTATYAKIASLIDGTLAVLKYKKTNGATANISDIEIALSNHIIAYTNFLNANFENGKVKTSKLADKATADANGNPIHSTYATKAENSATEGEVTKLKNGTTIVAKANADKDGNEFSNTYAKKADYVAKADVVDNTTSQDTNKPLSAKQGAVLKGLIDNIMNLLDSSDTLLDQTSEIVAYIKNNRSLIESITTSKISVTDIVDNVTSAVANKPLSANQGVVLKALIDALTTEVAKVNADVSLTESTPLTSAQLATIQANKHALVIYANEVFRLAGNQNTTGVLTYISEGKKISITIATGAWTIATWGGGGGSASIDDTTIATDKTWSSNKINTELGTKESTSNKKTSWGATPSDTNYPSEKLVKTECDNIRAVAEGKCKSYILSYSDTSINPHGGLYYTPSGNTLMPDQAIEYVNGYTNGNALFNSQNNSIDIGVESKFYYIFRTRYNEYIIYKSDVDFRTLMYPRGTVYTGDIFLVIETDVPDRWIGDGICYCLETKHGEITFATGTNQGQFKANNVDYSVNGLGTSDSPSFAGVKNNNYTHASKVFKITYSDDSVENVSFLAYAIPPASYTITNTLSNCSNSNNATTINEGQNYTATLTANNGYVMSSVAITKGTTDITATAYNSSTGAINISSVDGNISITATARLLATYTITNNLTHTNNSNTATSITEGYSYNGTLSAESGYEISSVLIKVNGVDKTSEVYNASTGAISISGVNGNIEITAISINISEYSITNNLTGVQTNNPSTTISAGASYSATLSVIDEGETIRRCSVYMGSENITSTAYDSSTGEITIDSVVGNVVITASTQTGRLPAGYTEVEYLESSGTQYINTGWIPDDDITKVETKVFEETIHHKTYVYGIYGRRFYLGNDFGLATGVAGVYTKNDNYSIAESHEIEVDISKSDKVYFSTKLDGTDLPETNNASLGTYTEYLFIFARASGVTPTNYFIGRIYRLTFYKGETKYHEYVPCKRDSDSKPGFYDLVSNTFKTNDGTGADFTLGPDVN